MKSVVLVFCLLCSNRLIAQHGSVIVELFTSQGCSSCPAADKNLTDAIVLAEKQGDPIIGLSFHVDYWNHIGWKDPYSSKLFTQRQRDYSEAMNLESLYTPQMIVNGKREFVGSDKAALNDAVLVARKQASAFQISIHGLKMEDDNLSFQYEVNGLPTDEVIHFAIVERGVENYVPRGENSGRKLHHDNVVRFFNTKSLLQKDQVSLSLKNSPFQKLNLILYIQDKSMQVMGATQEKIR